MLTDNSNKGDVTYLQNQKSQKKMLQGLSWS